MRSHQSITLQAPTGGLYRARGYQYKPPFTSERLENVRPFDVIEGRGRIGSRPGQIKAFAELLGSGAPVRLATWARTAAQITTSAFTDEFPGSAPQAHWSSFATSALPGGSATKPLPEASDGDFDVTSGVARVSTLGETLSMKLDLQSGIDYTAPFDVYITVLFGTPVAYEIILGLDDTTPDEGDCMSVVLVHKGNASNQECYLEIWENRTTVVDSMVFGGITDGWYTLRVHVNPNTPLLSGLLFSPTSGYLGSVDSFAAQSFAGDRFGLVLHERNEVTADARCSVFSVFGTPASAPDLPPELAVLSSNGSLYRENSSAVLEVVSGSDVDLTDDVRIYGQPHLQKVIIADYEIRQERLSADAAATIVSVSSGTSRLDDTAVTDWTALGIDADGDVVEVLLATGGSTLDAAVYPITAIHATNGVSFTVEGVKSATAVAYRILRYLKIYDTATDALTRHAVGSVTAAATAVAPAGCRSITLWNNRIVQCNNDIAPHGWWMSAAGYPFLYDYGDTGGVDEFGNASGTPLIPALGVAAAVNGTQSEFAGLLGEPLVTTIPIADDLLVFACRTSFYYLRGNPRDGGRMNDISRTIGIVGIGAWCRSSDGRLFAMTPDGLYEITINGAVPLSRDLIPKELLGLSDDRYETSLAYEVEKREVVISATAKDVGTTSIHYIYCLRTGGFFPDTRESDQEPTAVTSYQPGGVGIPRVIFGSRDGYVRKFSDAVEDDDGTDFDTRVRYGPIMLGGTTGRVGTLHELIVVLDVLSGDVTLEVRVGDSPQEASLASPRYTTTMTAGHNRRRYPRLTGGTAYVDIVGTPGSKWAAETIEATRQERGRLLTT